MLYPANSQVTISMIAYSANRKLSGLTAPPARPSRCGTLSAPSRSGSSRNAHMIAAITPGTA